MKEVDGFIAKEEGNAFDIKKLFVKYDNALRLRPLGFDEPCLGYYVGMDREVYINNVDIQPPFTPDMESKVMFRAPTYDQLLDWFRRKHCIWISAQYSTTAFKDIVVTINHRDLNDARDEEYQDYHEALEFGISKALAEIELGKTLQQRVVDATLAVNRKRIATKHSNSDNPVMGRNSCINKTNIYDGFDSIIEVPTLTTMDGYKLRLDCRVKEHRCWVIDLNKKDFLTEFETNVVLEMDTLRYFKSKEKAKVYIAGLNGHDIQLRGDGVGELTRWLNMSNQFLDSYYWASGVFRIRPHEYEPFTEVKMDMFDKIVKSKDGKTITRITMVNGASDHPYRVPSQHLSNNDLFKHYTFEDGSVIGKRK